MPLKITKKCPDKYHMDYEYKNIPAVQEFNGKSAWGVFPWTENPKSVLMNEVDEKELKLLADFDGSIYNWKKKGYSAELLLPKL